MSGIAIIAERVAPARGGLAVATARIARFAAQTGEAVHVIHPSKDTLPGGRGRTVVDGVVHHPVGELSKGDETSMAWHRHAKDVIEAHDLDLVHGIYATRAGYLAALLGRELGLPSVVSLRGNDLDRGLFRAQDLPRLERALAWADAVTGVSKALCKTASQVFGIHARHITNSVDPEAFRPQGADNSLRASMGLGREPVLGFLGELRDKKGMRYLLPAFDALRRAREASLLLIGGVRSDAQDAFRAFGRMAPESFARIKVIDYDRDPERLSRWMALCDVMLFPSVYDGTPNAVLEAMAAGRPILATDAGGQKDLIEHGTSGALLPVRELDLLPEAVLELLDLPESKRSALGKAARARAEAHHAPSVEREAYRTLYVELRSKRAAKSAS